MRIGDIITANKRKYKILKHGSNNFYLNDLERGGAICHVAWTLGYLQNHFAEQAIKFDVENRTTGIYGI